MTSYEDGGDGDRGVGLGLSIVKALVERMGGTLEMRNRPEGGAMAVLRVAHVSGDRPDHRLGQPQPVAGVAVVATPAS